MTTDFRDIQEYSCQLEKYHARNGTIITQKFHNLISATFHGNNKKYIGFRLLPISTIIAFDKIILDSRLFTFIRDALLRKNILEV